MKNKSVLLILLFFFCISYFSFSQSLGVSFSEQITGKPIYNKSTGLLIDDKELNKLLKANPGLALERVINKFGEVESFIYDPDKKGNFGTRDITQRTKPGDSFLPFVMTSVTKKTLDSEKLIGKIVLIQFYTLIKAPFFKEETFNRFESLVKDLQDKVEIEFITVTQSSEEDIKNQINITNCKSQIIPNGRNFYERYLITNFVAFVLIDKYGKLVSYYDMNNMSDIHSDILTLDQ